jgi:Kdo2-lipid IVA lauroyltransferase/acyltransferase
MNHVVYYLFVFPLSKLPLWFTYRFADLFYLLLITVLPYRKKVITANLTKSFPEKSRRNIAELRRKFYRTFADMMIEGVKNLGISEKELKKRFRIENLELMQQLYDEGKSVLLVSGHFNNWEWMITGQNLFFPHQAVGIGMPLSSGFWDKKINALRQRFGMHVIHSKIVKDTFQAYERKDVRIATLVLSDQSPGDTLKSYWTTFLGQPTAIAFGAEQLANAYDHAVVFYLPKKMKRGYYSCELQLITDSPGTLNWGEITEKHVSLLEEGIRKYPQGWLWSHKRWKRDLPEDPEALKREQHEKFNRLYRNR